MMKLIFLPLLTPILPCANRASVQLACAVFIVLRATKGARRCYRSAHRHAINICSCVQEFVVGSIFGQTANARRSSRSNWQRKLKNPESGIKTVGLSLLVLSYLGLLGQFLFITYQFGVVQMLKQ